jgi:broad specificity phosphatase PhoE
VTQLRHTDWPDRLWIVRHGQSASNVARDTAETQGLDLINVSTRDADTPLSDLGQVAIENPELLFPREIPGEIPAVLP